MAYNFGGIELDGAIEFEQLEVSGSRPARARLTLHRHRAEAYDRSEAGERLVHRSDGRYRVTLSRSGDDWIFRSRFPDTFVFSPRHRRVDCLIGSVDDRAWQDVLLRRVLPRIATTLGATAVHAASIALGDRCLLLLGRSGAGKSTLTAFCAGAGWRVLSDDTSLIWNEDARTVAEPVQHGIGVWGATRDALALPADRCAPMPGYDDGKWWYWPRSDGALGGSDLSAMVVIDRSPRVDVPTTTRVLREEALALLAPQIIPFVPGAPPDAATAASFGRVAAIARRVPCLRLVYPDGHAALPRTERLLRDLSPADAR